MSSFERNPKGGPCNSKPAWALLLFKVATPFKYFLSVRNSTILLTKIHLSSKVKYFLTRFDHNYFWNCVHWLFRNLAPRLTIDDGPIKPGFAGFGVAWHVLSGNITKDGDQRRPGGDRRAKRNFFAFYTLNLLSRFLSS